uniref:Uncharacterized protein n=1 Tax=Arundo donax TaxID=35708 RepID=A0A0A9EHY7_ARUDO
MPIVSSTTFRPTNICKQCIFYLIVAVHRILVSLLI